MRSYLSTTLLASILVAGAASAQMSTMDADGDMMLSEEEFSVSTTDFDRDGDGLLSEEEYVEIQGAEMEFSEIDEDGDGSLSQQEFSSGLLTSYDEEGDRMIGEEEYSAAEEDGWF